MLKHVILKDGNDVWLDLRSVDIVDQSDEGIVKLILSSGRAYEVKGLVSELVEEINRAKEDKIEIDLKPQELALERLERVVGSLGGELENRLYRILASQKEVEFDQFKRGNIWTRFLDRFSQKKS